MKEKGPQEFSRRRFLRWAPAATLLMAGGAGCVGREPRFSEKTPDPKYFAKLIKEGQTPEGYVFTGEGVIGRVTITFPLGNEHPEAGSYSISIKPEALVTFPRARDAFTIRLPFVVGTLMFAQAEPVQIIGYVGSFDNEAIVGWQVDVVTADLRKSHVAAFSWEDWKIRKFTWDGTERQPSFRPVAPPGSFVSGSIYNVRV